MPNARIFGAGFQPVQPVKPDYAIKLTERNIRQVALVIKGQVIDGILFLDIESGTYAARLGDYVVARAMYPQPTFEFLTEREYTNRYGKPLFSS